MKNNVEKIVLISGKARAGKDTTANYMKQYFESKGKKVIVLAFAYYLKEYVKNITGWDGKEETKPRSDLQYIGTDLIRNQIDKDLFVNRIIEDIKVYGHFFDIVILDDTRMLNEIENIKDVFDNVITINVVRPNFVSELNEKQKAHATENELNGYNFDFEIINDGSLEDLETKVLEIGSEIL